MFERMVNLEKDSSWLRNLLLFDPRGSVNAAVNLITPPIRADADIGMIVMESDYFVPMSGSNLICTVTVALETA
jgi:proline racemase